MLWALLLWCVIPEPAGHYDVDSYGYDPIAWHFAQTGTLTDPHNIESAPVQPVGYHFVLGMLYWLFGHNLVAVIWFQVMLTCCAIILLMHIAQLLFNTNVAWWVGLLVASNLGFIIYSQLILAETVLLFVLLFFLERYVQFLKTGSGSYIVQSAFCLGVSMLIKPVAALLLAPLVIITYCAHKVCFTDKITFVLLLLLGFCLPNALYMARNYLQYGSFAFAPMTQLNLYQCLLAKVIGIVEDKDPQEITETTLRFQAVHSLDECGWQHAKEHFYAYLFAYPHLFVRIWLINVLKTWFGLYATQLKQMIEPKSYLEKSHLAKNHLDTHSFFNQHGSLMQRLHAYIVGGTTSRVVVFLAWFELCYAFIRFMLAVLGLYALWRNKQHILLWLFLSMMISFSILTGIDGCCRYRITYEPILILLAGVGIMFVYSYYDERIKEHWYGISW